jgi:dTDP-4-amino-4,6-dideoxygalactose transaminase
VIEVPAEVRDDLVAVLCAENVFARRYFHPGCHRHPPYRDGAPAMPVTEATSARVVTLPTGTAVSEDDVGRVTALIKSVLLQAPAIRQRLDALPDGARER